MYAHDNSAHQGEYKQIHKEVENNKEKGGDRVG